MRITVGLDSNQGQRNPSALLVVAVNEFRPVVAVAEVEQIALRFL